MKKLLVVFLITSIAGCAIDKKEYPSDWASLSTNISKLEDSIVGEYECNGKYSSGNYSISLPDLLGIQNIQLENCKYVVITKAGEGKLEIKFNDEHQERISKIQLSKGKDFNANGDLLVLTGIGEGGINRGGVVGFSVEKIFLTLNTDKDLIIKRTENSAGIVLLIPVAGSTTNWIKYSRAP